MLGLEDKEESEGESDEGAEDGDSIEDEAKLEGASKQTTMTRLRKGVKALFKLKLVKSSRRQDLDLVCGA